MKGMMSMMSRAIFLMVVLLPGCQIGPWYRQSDSNVSRYGEETAMKREGEIVGVAPTERTGPAISVGTKNPGGSGNFGTYDSVFISAVQAKLHALLDEQEFAKQKEGRIVAEFRLHSDGRITDWKILENELSEKAAWICQMAVVDQAPYKPLPEHLQGKQFRDVRFTFFHHSADRKKGE